MGWEHYQTVDPLEKEPRVRRGLFGVRLLILHFKFQFSKSISQNAQKSPNTLQKTAKHCMVNVLNGGIWHCLKRERDIGTKATLSDVQTAFR